MTPTKLLIGQILVVFAIVLAGIWLATQWAAAELAYQAELGVPWAVIDGIPVYRPWAIFLWWYHFNAYAPHVFDRAGAIAGASGFVGCAAAVAGSLWRARQHRNVTTYGSAHWASLHEAKAAGLFSQGGVFLGRLGDRDLRHDGPEHVMAFAPTRSGKGVGLVVPTLLGWSGSAVIHDIKGENWQLTAGWRAKFSHCLLFNPTDARSARYNPLLEVRRGADEVRDCQNIATCWSTRKGRSNGVTTGRRPAIRCWSARSCTCSTRKKTRRSPASRPSFPTRSVRSRRRCAG